MAVNVSGGALEFDATINMTDFERKIVQMQSGINSLNQNQKKTASEMENWAGRASAAAAGFFSLQAATGFLTKMVAVRGEFQQVTMAFTTMLKSKDAANRLMAESVALAATTPFNLTDVATGAKQLLAYGFNARDVTKELTKLGNVAAGVGSQLNDVVYLYGTLKASGRVTQMDINQFANRGIPIYEELAKAMNKPVSSIRDLSAAGKIGFKDIEKAFASMTSPAGKFFNLMEEQSKSLTGQLANLEDAFDQMLNKMGAASEDSIGGLITGLANIVENYERMLEVLQLIVGIYGAYRAALIINNVLITYNAVVTNAAGVSTKAWTAAEVIQLTVWKLKEAALIRLNALVKSGALSVALYTASIAAVGAVVYSFAQAQTGAEIAQEALNKSKEVGIRQYDKETEKLDRLLKVLRDANSSRHEAKEAYESLLLNTNKVLDKYSQEEIAAGKADKAMESYKQTMKKAAEESANFQAFKEIGSQIDEIAEKGTTAISMWDKLAKTLTISFKNIWGALSGEGVEWGTLERRSKDIAASVTTDLKDAQGNLMKQDPSIQKKLDQERKDRDKELKKEAEQKSQAEIDAAKKAAEKYAAIIERRNELERSMAENLKVARSKSMSEEEQEIISINKRYNDQEAAIKKLNKSLLDKDKISLKANDSARMLELGVAGVQSSIYGKGGYQEELEKKREMYENFERDKQTFGLDIARNMYKDELGQYDTFTKFVQADIDSRKKEDPSFANRLKGEVATPLLIDSGKEDREREKQRLAEALQGSQTFEAERAMLTAKYASMRNTILSDANIVDKNGRIQALSENEKLDNDALITEHNSRMGWAKRLNEELLVLTRSQVKEQIKLLESQFKDTQMPQGVAEYMEKLKKAFEIGADQASLNNVNDRISDTLTAIAGESDKSSPKVQQLNKDLLALLKLKKELDGDGDGKADKGLGKWLKSLGNGSSLMGGIEAFKMAGDAALQLSAALGGVDTAVGYTLDSIGQLTNAAAGLAQGIATADPAAIVGGAMKLVTTVIGISARTKKMNQDARDAIEAWYKKAISGEQEYQNLLKQRAVDRAKDGKNAIQGIVSETKARQDQLQGWADEEARIMASLQGMEYVVNQTTKHGTWFRKEKTTKEMASLAGKSFEDLQLLLKQGKIEGEAKTMVERLIEMEKAGYDSKKALEELAKQYDELMTGTSQQGLSDAFFDFIKSGKTASEDIAEFFEKTMLDSAQSIFKNNILQDMVNDYYKSFAAAAKKDGGMTADDRENLKKQFAQLGENAKKAYEDFLATVGVDPLAAVKEEGAKGALKRELTETTASEFLGITRASYDLNVQTLASTQIIEMNIVQQTNLSSQKLNVLLDIAVSTNETAKNTKFIEEMKNTLNKIAGGATVDPVNERDLGV